MKIMIKLTAICFALLLGSAFCEEMEDHDEDHHEDEHHSGNKPYHRELSDHDHHADDPAKHDPRYDHEAFLGKDESAKFDQLSPEESKQRLTELIDKKVDLDNDGKVTAAELRAWITKISGRSVFLSASRQFQNAMAEIEVKDINAPMSWESYMKWKKLQHHEERKYDTAKDTAEKIMKDKKKWKLADQDGDGLLSQAEYVNFLHPEEAPHMRDYVIEEALETIDKNKDGKISEDEYLQDMYFNYTNDTAEKKKLPEWLESERDAFRKTLDKNKDGSMDRNEIYKWIVPTDKDGAIKETKHLMDKADINKDHIGQPRKRSRRNHLGCSKKEIHLSSTITMRMDGVLTKEEILKKHDLFAGSQVTDYGSAMTHEEL